MNPKRCNEYDYINFLVAAQKSYSCLEASRVHPLHAHAPAHDVITRCLHTINPDNDALWQEAEPMVEKDKGLLVIDDLTLAIVTSQVTVGLRLKCRLYVMPFDAILSLLSTTYFQLRNY